MPAIFRLHAELERQIALLGDADEGHGRRHAGHDVMRDDAALIEGETEPHAAFGEDSGDRRRTMPPVDLFVMAERQIDGALGRKTVGQQKLDRLQGGENGYLVVERAPPQMKPSAMVPEKGLSCQAPRLSGSTGTTSICANRRIGWRAASRPRQV